MTSPGPRSKPNEITNKPASSAAVYLNRYLLRNLKGMWALTTEN